MKQLAKVKEKKMVKLQLEERMEEDVVIEEEEEEVEENIEAEVAIEEIEEIMKVEEVEVAKEPKVMEASSIETRDHELLDHPRIRRITISQLLVRRMTSEEVEEEATTTE